MKILNEKRKPRKRLTDEQVEEVRLDDGRQVDIAIRYGVSQTLVSLIKGGKKRVKK